MIDLIDIIECAFISVLAAVIVVLSVLVTRMRNAITGLAWYIKENIPGELPKDVETVTGRRGNHRGP